MYYTRGFLIGDELAIRGENKVYLELRSLTSITEQMLPSELLYLVTQHLNHQDYAALMDTSPRLCALLYSERFLSVRAAAEGLRAKAYARGLTYLRQHPTQNYHDNHMQPTDAYFRWFDDCEAIDIFGQVWTRVEYNRVAQWKKVKVPFRSRIKKIFDFFDAPVKDKEGWFTFPGYLVLTYSGKIISWAEISEEGKNRGDTWLIVKDAQAVDVALLGSYLIYQTMEGKYFMSDMHIYEEIPIEVPLRDVASIEASVHNGALLEVDTYLDTGGNLHLPRDVIASVKQVSFAGNRYIHYLHHSGLMIRYRSDQRGVLGVDVKLFLNEGKYLYLLTYTNELHRIDRKSLESKRIMSFSRPVRRLQQASSGDWLVEYEK